MSGSSTDSGANFLSQFNSPLDPKLESTGVLSSTVPLQDPLNSLASNRSSLNLDPLNAAPPSDVGFDPSFMFNSGWFTVGNTGQVSIDYLYDGGLYEGDVGVFSLEGLDEFVPGSTEFIQAVVQRVLSNSALGHLIISDQNEGARFESGFNAGDYLGVKTFAMNAGDRFGMVLVPNGTFYELAQNPTLDGSQRPLFSLSTANPTEGFQFGQIADVTGNGSTFVFEDLRVDSNSDRDYEDIVLQVRGAIGFAPSLDEVINPGNDWRNSEIGQRIYGFVTQEDLNNPNSRFPRPMPSTYVPGNALETAGSFTPASNGKSYAGILNLTEESHYHKFSLGVENIFTMSVESWAPTIVELLDTNGQVLQRKSTDKRATVSFNELLDAGSYYIRVANTGDNVTPYQMTASTQPLIDGLTTGGSDEIASTTDQTIETSNGGVVSIQTNPAASSLIGVDRLRADSRFVGINGSGFATVILDTGIDSRHSFFGTDTNGDGIADRIVFQYDYVYGDTTANDIDGHGSHVSSIATSSNGVYVGIAPNSNIIHLKVLGDDGRGNFSYVEQALQWVVANATRYNIASVNMSLGAGENETVTKNYWNVSDELAQLVARNIIPVAAAGNDFFRYQSQGVSGLAADPNALAVSAVWDRNQGGWAWGGGSSDYSTAADRITSFSQRSTTLTDIFAPGAMIYGAAPGGGIDDMGGTSQAAPHIAGIATLMQQLAVRELGRRLTFSEFTNLLKTTGVSIYDGDDENDNVANTNQSYKRVDVYAMANAILAMRPKPKSTISLSTPDWNAEEKNWGETPNPGRFTISRSGGDNSQAETIFYSVSGTATNGSDYSSLSSSITIPAGQASIDIPINIINDAIVENPETVTINLTSSSNYNLSSTSTSGTVWIYDNDVPAKSTINLSVSDWYASETNSWETPNPGSFTVSRSGGDNSRAETVFYTVSGSATNGLDYNSLLGSVTIPAGQTSINIPVNVFNDSQYENTESVNISLYSNGSYNLNSNTTGTVWIYDNDPSPTEVMRSKIGAGSRAPGLFLSAFDSILGSNYDYVPTANAYRWGNGWTQELRDSKGNRVLIMLEDGATTAYTVFGSNLDEYLFLGGPVGKTLDGRFVNLGYPRSNENAFTNPRDGRRAVWQQFAADNGKSRIHNLSGFASVATWGTIGSLYTDMGGAGSWLGMATRREYFDGDTVFADFQGGRIAYGWNNGRVEALRPGVQPSWRQASQGSIGYVYINAVPV